MGQTHRRRWGRAAGVSEKQVAWGKGGGGGCGIFDSFGQGFGVRWPVAG